MRARRFRPPLIALAAVLVACSKLPLALPEGAPVAVAIQRPPEEARKFDLAPSSTKYQQLESWLSNNQRGWSAYLATAPGEGIYVSLVGGNLQFVGSTVLACPTAGACMHKAVLPSEYSFLEAP